MGATSGDFILFASLSPRPPVEQYRDLLIKSMDALFFFVPDFTLNFAGELSIRLTHRRNRHHPLIPLLTSFLAHLPLPLEHQAIDYPF